jgi:RNA polymerase sigma-70 factor (ECF subfamily)
MSCLEDEAELIRRSQQGELDAFNRIVACYQDQVYNLCLRMLGSQQPAEDAAQEAFISAFRSVKRVHGGTFRAWLLRIASNACIDELRRLRRRPQQSIDAPSGEDDASPALQIADTGEGPEQAAVRAELRAALQAGLLELPDDQRLAVVLCDVQGLSYDEIAVAMACSVGTVKSRISRARMKLRAQLQKRPELFGELVRHKDVEIEPEEVGS